MKLLTLATIGTFFHLASCGLTDPHYEDYTSTSSGPVDASTECGKTAVTSYTTNISSAVDGTCAGSSCHGGGAGGVTLTAGSHEANRLALYNYTGLDKEKLVAYVESSAHPGKTLATGQLTNDAVTSWLNQEEACINGSSLRGRPH